MANALAGPSTNALAQEGYRPQQHRRGNTYGTRHGGPNRDQGGAPKGNGWLGLLQRPDGGVMTEYTMGVPINGQEMEIPSIVPTLTQGEVDILLNMQPGDKMPGSIRWKAIKHAESRLEKGYSPFFD